MAANKHEFDLPAMDDLPAVESDDEFDFNDDFAFARSMPAAPDADDELFAALFAQEFGRTLVSDELKASIVSQIEATAAPAAPRHLKVVEGGAAPAPRRRSTRSFKLRFSRMAAAAALVLVAVSGGIALRAPTAFVSVSGPESTIQLGINVFGMTVSATSNDPAGQEMLSTVNVGNMGYEDSLRVLADMMGGANPAGMNVEVSSVTDGQKSSLEDSSLKVLDILQAQRTSEVKPTVKPELPASPAQPVKPEFQPEVLVASAVPSTPDSPLAPAAPTYDATPAPSAGSSVVAAPERDSQAAEEPATPLTPDTPDEPELPDGPAEDIGQAEDDAPELIATDDDPSVPSTHDTPTGVANAEVVPVVVNPTISLEEGGVTVVPQSNEIVSILD